MRQIYYKSSVTYEAGILQELSDLLVRDITRSQWLMRQGYYKSSVTYEADILKELSDA